MPHTIAHAQQRLVMLRMLKAYRDGLAIAERLAAADARVSTRDPKGSSGGA